MTCNNDVIQSAFVLHQYLGTDLEEFSGRTVLDDECAISLPLLHLPGVVLVPGDTLPLHLFNPRLISMMKHILQNNRTFGMLYDRLAQKVVVVMSEVVVVQFSVAYWAKLVCYKSMIILTN